MSLAIEQIERRLAELRENASPPDAPFDWDDVEYLRLLSEKLKIGHATGFNHRWFADMAEKLKQTLQAIDGRAEDAAFGQQCYQDRCENAYVEASVVKRLEKEKAELQKIADAAKNYVEAAIAEGGATDDEEQEAAEERTGEAWEELCLRLPTTR